MLQIQIPLVKVLTCLTTVSSVVIQMYISRFDYIHNFQVTLSAVIFLYIPRDHTCVHLKALNSVCKIPGDQRVFSLLTLVA